MKTNNIDDDILPNQLRLGRSIGYVHNSLKSLRIACSSEFFLMVEMISQS
jgi:hypothetical protein